jgi:hypothetical protein
LPFSSFAPYSHSHWLFVNRGGLLPGRPYAAARIINERLSCVRGLCAVVLLEFRMVGSLRRRF